MNCDAVLVTGWLGRFCVFWDHVLHLQHMSIVESRGFWEGRGGNIIVTFRCATFSGILLRSITAARRCPQGRQPVVPLRYAAHTSKPEGDQLRESVPGGGHLGVALHCSDCLFTRCCPFFFYVCQRNSHGRVVWRRSYRDRFICNIMGLLALVFPCGRAQTNCMPLALAMVKSFLID